MVDPFAAHGKLAYQHFEHSLVLDTVMRQTGESAEKFKSILNSVAEGDFQPNQYQELMTRELELLSPEEKAHFQSHALKLCARNKDLVKHNLDHINSLNTPIAAIAAMHTGYGSIADSRVAGGLPKNTVLAKGARVYLSSNEWREAGLVNGACGTVVGIVYREGFQPPSLPDFVLVQFDNYIGPSCLEGMERVVPICPITRNWIARKIPSSRTMIPLFPAYAISIHKSQVALFCNGFDLIVISKLSSQGMTLDDVIINLGPEEFAIGLCYTALSRCRSMEKLAFDNCTFKRMTCYYSRINHRLRKDEDERLLELQKDTLKSLASKSVEELFTREKDTSDSFSIPMPMEVDIDRDNPMELDTTVCVPMEVDFTETNFMEVDEFEQMLANIEI